MTSLLQLLLLFRTCQSRLDRGKGERSHTQQLSHAFLFFSLYRLADAIKNRMLMLDGMPSVRVKAEPLESERGVREQLFFIQFSPYHITVPLLHPKLPPTPSLWYPPNYSQAMSRKDVCVCGTAPMECRVVERHSWSRNAPRARSQGHHSQGSHFGRAKAQM